jgi:fucose permease
MLAAGLGWRPALGSMAGVVAAVTVLLFVTRHRWAKSPPRRPPAHDRRAGLLAGAVLTAVESGIETAAGVWAYVFLTAGRGVAPVVAGVVVSAYWATMVVGRASLGVLAGRIGARRVLAWAIGTVPVGALLMAVPGPPFVAVAGLIVLGLATAPVFPLLTFTTGGATTAVGLQVAASSVGSAALPSAVGLLIGGVGAPVLGPSLLVLGVLMCVLYPLRR